MSGDSPSAHITQTFDFIDDRSSSAPTTSKDIGIQSAGIVEASVLVEQQKDKDKDKDDEEVALCNPAANNPDDSGTRDSDTDKTLKLEDSSDAGDKGHGDKKDNEDKKNNDNTDNVDGALLPSKSEKQYDEYNNPEDDSCCIKCLSVTLQCCECTII